MTSPRYLLQRVSAPWYLDAFERAAARSIGGGKPEQIVEFDIPLDSVKRNA